MFYFCFISWKSSCNLIFSWKNPVSSKKKKKRKRQISNMPQCWVVNSQQAVNPAEKGVWLGSALKRSVRLKPCRGASHLAAHICKLSFGRYPGLIIMDKFWNEDRMVEQIKRYASFAPHCTRRCRAVFTWLAVTPQWPLLWLDLNPTLWCFRAYWLGEIETETETGILRVLEKQMFIESMNPVVQGLLLFLFAKKSLIWCRMGSLD